MEVAAPRVWARRVSGVNLLGRAFGDQFPRPALLVFLRHFG